MRRPACFLVLLLASSGARPAAAEDDPRDVARSYYERGVAMASRRMYESALRSFNDAYAASPHFAVFYNIGQCHLALDHSAEAVEALSKYLSDGRYHVPPERRAQVMGQISLLQSRMHVERPAGGAGTPPLGSAAAARAAANEAAEAAGAAARAANAAARAAARAKALADAAEAAEAAAAAMRSATATTQPKRKQKPDPQR